MFAHSPGSLREVAAASRPPALWCRSLRLALLVCLLAAMPAAAFVPDADRVEAAVAEARAAAGRAAARGLEVELQTAEGKGRMRDELLSHPTGLARRELRRANGSIVRQLLQGSALATSRDAQPVANPRVLLPPLFVLQAESAATLRAGLESFGVLVDVVGLADCGESDCLVLGDPAREVPRPELPELAGLETAMPEQLGDRSLNAGEAPASDEVEQAVAPDETEQVAAPEAPAGEPDAVGEASAEAAEATPAADTRLWVDIESYEIRGMDLRGGVRIRLGPIASFDRLRLPAWFSVEQPDQPKARFQLLRASRVTAPAAAFTRSWLFAPPVPGNSPYQPQSSSAPANP